MKSSWMLGAVLAMASLGVRAEAVLSCEEVDEVGVSLTELGILMDDENAEIGVGTEADDALAETTVGLADIADAEQDAELQDASVAMAEAWQAADRDAFTDALAVAVVRLASISAADCP